MSNIIINTGLIDIASEDVLNSVIGQMSDGMWENSRVMEHYWPFVEIKRIKDRVCIVVDTTYNFDSVCIVIDGSKYHQNTPWNNWFLRSDKLGKDPEKIKQFFANKIRQIVRENAKDYNWKNKRMSEKNTNVLQYMSSYHKDENGNYPDITVADAYRVYVALKA